MKMNRLAWAALIALATVASTQCVMAQNYPTKNIRLLVGYPPGGLTDGVARTLAPRLAEVLGHQVYVDNRAGGGSTIGTDMAAKAPPDGYTLLVADQALISNPSLYAKLPFDTLKDFQPVAVAGAAALVIIVHPSLPARTMKELVALDKAKPGSINYASGGNGTATHLAGELFKQVAGVDFVHIPYKGAGVAIIDLLSGQVSLMFSSVGPAAPHVNVGKIKALAVTGESRLAVLPGVPTLAEVGYPAATVLGYWGVVAPAGIPRDVLDKLSTTIAAVVKRPDVRQRLLEQGVDPTGAGPAEYDRIIRAEIAKWANVIKQAGIKVE